MTAQEYNAKRNELMTRWEQECRTWLAGKNNELGEEVYDVNATFFKDGVIDPDTWFSENNSFRPLFILKEVNDQTPSGNNCFDFVAMDESNGHDIWNGIGHWRDFATFVYAMINHINANESLPPYKELRHKLFEQKNIDFREALKKVAVINIKKLAGGGKVGSNESQKTILFQIHAKHFKDNLRKQIVEQIQPNIIIFFGKDIDRCFELKENMLYNIPTVSGFHSSINPKTRNKAFYNDTITKIKEISTNM